jgi:hypothetical protein
MKKVRVESQELKGARSAVILSEDSMILRLTTLRENGGVIPLLR